MFANVTLSLMGGFVTTVQLFCLTLVFALPLGLVISMSTVFVKQHSILDVFVAIPVCVILYFIIYHRAFVKKFGKAANRDA